MRFKNFQKQLIVVTSATGGHCVRFAPGQERDIPDHMEDAVLAKGLVPLEDFIEAVERKSAVEAAEDEVIRERAETEEAEAALAKAKALSEASEKASAEARAKRSAAAKKAAATRARNNVG